MSDRPCPVCDNPVPLGRYGRARVYCSRECGVEARRQGSRATGVEARSQRFTICVTPSTAARLDEVSTRAGMRICEWLRELVEDTFALEDDDS